MKPASLFGKLFFLAAVFSPATGEPVPANFAKPPKASCTGYFTLIQLIEAKGTQVCSKLYTKTDVLSGTTTTTITATSNARITKTTTATRTSTLVIETTLSTTASTETVSSVSSDISSATITSSVDATITQTSTVFLTTTTTSLPSRAISVAAFTAITPHIVIKNATAFPPHITPSAAVQKRQQGDDSWTSKYDPPDLRSACACIVGVGATSAKATRTSTKRTTRTATVTRTKLSVVTSTSTSFSTISLTSTTSTALTESTTTTATELVTQFTTLVSTSTIMATSTSTFFPDCVRGYDSTDAGTGNRVEVYPVDVVKNKDECCAFCGQKPDCLANVWMFGCNLLMSENGEASCPKDIVFGIKEGNVYPGPCGY